LSELVCDFQHRNVLITGASRGLGLSIAEAFWKHGANLLLVARTAEALDAASAGFRRQARTGQQVHCLPCDLSAASTAEWIVAQARSLWGRLDVLVNNAAILGPIGCLWENPWDEWEAAIRVNLLTPAALCRAAIPWMREQGGAIVNISGGGATGPRPFFSAYGTAKAGLVRLSETLARETAGSGIRVNCVAPGAMNTQMNTAVLQAGAALSGAGEFERAQRQAESGGTPPNLAAELTVFLASPAASEITGRLISAVWDPWKSLPSHARDLESSDIYTLRRIVPEDRGKTWDPCERQS
jgi:NAD(P)-dependent dehydrogenase (short-subunit alcohol dehydrogenase family)